MNAPAINAPAPTDPTQQDLSAPDLAVQDVSSLAAQAAGMNAIDGSWSLPPLPDTVKADLLASSHIADGPAMTSFLWGVHGDLMDSTRPSELPAVAHLGVAPAAPATSFTPTQPVPGGALAASIAQQQALKASQGQADLSNLPAATPPPTDIGDNLRRIWNGVAGQSAPALPDMRAVENLKLRGIREGLLPASTPLDSRWDPAMNNVRAELMKSDVQSRILGNRPGSVKTSDIMSLIDDWVGPEKLLSAGITLGFVPNLGHAAKKLSDFGDSHNPLDLLSAAADVALPVLNDALLFTGVSEVFAFTRAAELAAEAGTTAGLDAALQGTGSVLGRSLVSAGEYSNLGRLGRLGAINTADVAGEVDRFQHAGIIASRLSERSGALGWAGDQMVRWRQQFAVMAAKKAVQQGMKLGFAGRLESAAVPDLSTIGLGGAGNQSDRAQQLQDQIGSNPWTGTLAAALQLPFAPTSTFKPGTFTGPIGAGAKWLVGAVSGVSQDARMTGLYFNWTHQLTSATQGTEAADKLMAEAKTIGVRQALANALAGGDPDKLGRLLTYVATSGAVDMAADAKIAAVGAKGTQGEWGYWLTARNAIINRLRVMDAPLEGDLDGAYQFAQHVAQADTLTGIENAAAMKKATAGQQAAIQQVMSDLGEPDGLSAAAKIVEHHNNVVRSDTLNELFNQPGLDKYLAGHYADMWDRISNWDDFNASVQRVQELYAGENLQFEPVTFGDGGTSWAPAGIRDSVIGVPLTERLPVETKRSGLLSSFGGNIDPEQGAFTVARLGTLTRQQAAGVHAYLTELLQARDTLKSATDESGDFLWPRFGQQFAQDNALGSVSPAEVKDQAAAALDGMGPGAGVSRPQLERYLNTLRYVGANGGDPQDALTFVEQKLQELDRASFWSQRNLNMGATPIEQKAAELASKQRYLASEVQVPADMAASLGARGYVAVHGREFMQPDDLMGLAGPFGDVTRGDLQRVQLGTFFTPHAYQDINQLRDNRFRSLLAGAFNAEGNGLEPQIDPHADFHFPDGGDANYIVDELNGRLRDMKQNALEAADLADSQGFLARSFTRLAGRQVPFSIWDLPGKTVRDVLEPVYGADGTTRILGALKQSSYLGWEVQGLSSIESYLKANSWARLGLQAFAKTDAAETMGEWSGFRRAGVGVMSGLAALAAGATPAQAGVIGATRGLLPGEGLQGRALAAGAGAAGMAGLAALQGGDVGQAALSGAALGGLAPSGEGQLINPRFALGFAGARVAGGLANAQDILPVSSPVAAGLGVAAGVASAWGAGRAAETGLARLASNGSLWGSRAWDEYSKLGEGLANLRDRLRFSLNPFFDVHRAATGAIMNGTADLPDGFHIPLLSSRALEGEADAREWAARFSAASRGQVAQDEIDATQRFFTQTGILGYNPTRWMSGAFKSLVGQGMDEERAAGIVRNLYSYGTQGRTGAELSANFMFFPFSYQKKYLTQVAKFASQDVGRVVLMHDALKTYEVLNDRYDLSSALEQHAPLLKQLATMNAFAFGLNPGELGGVNRPLIEAAQASPLGNVMDPVLNAFLPQGWKIEPGTDTNRLGQIANRLVPVYRDIANLVDDTASQGHVLFSPSHETDAAEVSDAYSAWNEFKTQVEGFAKSRGITYDTLMRSPKYTQFKQYIQQKRAEIAQQYPAWGQAQAKAASNAIFDQQELSNIAANPQSATDMNVADFATALDQTDADLRKRYGVTIRNEPDAVPPNVFQGLRALAAQYAAADPGFGRAYDRYFLKVLGPITTELH